MGIKQVIPYINFTGDAAKAIEIYSAALGAETIELMRYGDMKEHKCPDTNPQWIMHAHLRIGGAELMVNDLPPIRELTRGQDVNINLQWDDLEAMRRAFAALAEGGKVTMDLHETFWGATFGTLHDRFGVSWMMNCPKA